MLPSRQIHEESMHQRVRQALRAWQDAQKYFEAVSDPDLVDVASYDMEAARRRYIYMLKCIRNGE